jgi:peptidoglycan L-alanyl-D-glutamate endopeptidase CwlK
MTMIKSARSVCLFLLLLSVAMAWMPIGTATYAKSQSRGTPEDPIIDSKMTEKEAFDGLDSKCPEEIRKRQRVIKVKYYSSDKKIHQGQLVIDGELEKNIKTVFEVALKERFPIYSAIPISDKRFRKDDRWDDNLSMEANNTSAFNYRLSTGSTQLSKHAYGRAIDINPFQNPYSKGSIILPQGAKYNPNVEGTLTVDHPIVRTFLRLGWEWGGNWTTLKDYQHFEKLLKK